MTMLEVLLARRCMRGAVGVAKRMSTPRAFGDCSAALSSFIDGWPEDVSLNKRTLFMNGLARSLVVIVICGALHSFVSSRSQAQGRSNESRSEEAQSKHPVEFLAAPEVDEQLFMIRRLEDFFTRWPSDFSDREKATGAISNLRHELILAHTYLQEKDCDKRLIAMYSDSIAMAERYGEFLADIGAINADFKRRIDGTGTLVEGVETGVKAGAGLALAAVEPVTATLAIGGLMIKQGIATYEERNRLNQEQAAAVDRRLDKYLAERSRLIGHVEVQAEVLAEKHGWEAAEVGFDQDEEESKRLADAITSSDFQFLTEHLQGLQAARPRDPFVYASAGGLKETQARSVGTLSDKEAARLHREAKEQYLRAARLVPHGRFHDSLRCDYLWKAAGNASLRLYYETQAKDEDAIVLAEAALRSQPRDPTGKLRFTKAFALVRNGRANEAVEVFNSCASALEDKASTHYDCACLLSLAGRSDESIRHLDIAWAKGQRHLVRFRTDRDLANVRAEKPQWFNSKTPELNVQVNYGWIWNTADIRNSSGFPLTEVVVEVSLCSPKNEVRTEVYPVGRIADGEVRQFNGVFDGPESWEDKQRRRVRFLCAEKRVSFHDGMEVAVGQWIGSETVIKRDGSDVGVSSPLRLRVSKDADGLLVTITGGKHTNKWGQWGRCQYREGLVRSISDEAELQEGIGMFVDGDSGYGTFRLPYDDAGYGHAFMVRRLQK